MTTALERRRTTDSDCSWRTWIPGDELIDFLEAEGAVRTDVQKYFPGGEKEEQIKLYVDLMERGGWYEGDKPVPLDARSGRIGWSADRTDAVSRVDWGKVRAEGHPIPSFLVEIKHRRPNDSYPGCQCGRWS